MPGRLDVAFRKPAILTHSALKIFLFCDILRIKTRPLLPKAFTYQIAMCVFVRQFIFIAENSSGIPYHISVQ